MGCVLFHMGLWIRGSLCCESLSQKSKIFASSLWQGSLYGQCPLTISHGNLQQIVTEQNGERKRLHCAPIDSGGTPPGVVTG